MKNFFIGLCVLLGAQGVCAMHMRVLVGTTGTIYRINTQEDMHQSKHAVWTSTLLSSLSSDDSIEMHVSTPANTVGQVRASAIGFLLSLNALDIEEVRMVHLYQEDDFLCVPLPENYLLVDGQRVCVEAHNPVLVAAIRGPQKNKLLLQHIQQRFLMARLAAGNR